MIGIDKARIIIAIVLLCFAYWMIATHFWILYLGLRNKLKGRNDRLPSGVTLVPVLIALIAWLIAPKHVYISYACSLVLLIDPFNWLLVFYLIREAIKRVKQWI